MNELQALTVAKGLMNNKQAIALLAANGITLGELPVIMDIVDLKPATAAARLTKGLPSAKMVYVIGTAETGASGTTNSFDAMNAFAAAGQEMTASVHRAKMVLNDTVIAANNLAKGAPLTLNINGVDMESRIEIHESDKPMRVGQESVGYLDKAGIRVDSKKNGKKYYRDTKLTTPDALAHQLIGTSVASIVE